MAGVSAAIQGASHDDLIASLAHLSHDKRKRLGLCVGGVDGGPLPSIGDPRPAVETPSKPLQRLSMNTCARPGCANPGRGSGGTSKYCSLACLEADESDDEIDSAPLCETASVSASTLAMSIEQLKVNFHSVSSLIRLIFLDVDGVLNCLGQYAVEASDEVITGSPAMFLNRYCLRRLVGLVHDTQASLVLSSTWRDNGELKSALWEALVDEGLPENAFIGQTPIINSRLRPYEIKAWLDTHLQESASKGRCSWIVLDDMQLGHAQEIKDHFVWIDPHVGLSDKDVGKAKSMMLSPVC